MTKKYIGKSEQHYNQQLKKVKQQMYSCMKNIVIYTKMSSKASWKLIVHGQNLRMLIFNMGGEMKLYSCINCIYQPLNIYNKTDLANDQLNIKPLQ